MKIVFYKLPREAGENVIITEGYNFVDSEIALYLEEDDLSQTFYDIGYEDGEKRVARVEEEPHDVDPYLIVDGNPVEIEGTLPFRGEESATRFIDALLRWQEYLNEAYDE